MHNKNEVHRFVHRSCLLCAVRYAGHLFAGERGLASSTYTLFILYPVCFMLHSLASVDWLALRCTLYFILYTLYSILYTLFAGERGLAGSTLYFILYTLYFILYTLYSILYTLFAGEHVLAGSTTHCIGIESTCSSGAFLLYTLYFLLYT